jgi:hypothetical protein
MDTIDFNKHDIKIFINNVGDIGRLFKITRRLELTVSFPLIMSDAFSPIIIDGAFVFAEGIFLITDASTIRSPEMPLTL